ncbi:unnamed protein product [Phytophthora fragariaefolia]|uniref:Unnamed protein product n=1 Tax=Phytophthora fragariaefolia TaxID=1490495 RepID=A0A9W6YPC2_9STRA|nr:unnamed protein product [Phytophthora fragariaefolia]
MAVELPTLPDLCDAVVTIKIGEPLTDCRIERLKRLFVDDTAVIWPDDAAIYVKSTVNARQHEYNRLPDDEQGFIGFLKAVWTRFRRQGKRIPLFLYVNRVKKTNPIHRATASRVAQATKNISELLQSENREPPGPASVEYWATVQARQPDGAPIVQPDNETFRQLNYVDRQAEQHRQELLTATAESNRPTRRIHIHLNGVAVPIDINIQELRDVLGLPGYDLRPPFRARIIPPTAEPHDLADVDHDEEKDDEEVENHEEEEDEEKTEQDKGGRQQKRRRREVHAEEKQDNDNREHNESVV